MKYHYQEGISDSKRGGRKLKLFFVGIFSTLAVGYIGFLALTPVLNGWPLVSIDETANALESIDPGSKGNKLFIPRINVTSPESNLEIEGDPSREENVTIQGQRFKLHFTPQQTKQNSPFYYLDKLQNGDEIFLDYNNKRYAYRVSSNIKSKDSVLTLKASGGATVKAQFIGTVALESDSLEINSEAF